MMRLFSKRPAVAPLPLPWQCCATWPIGGLFQVGYAENSDFLLVLSWQGRGVFDCRTGEKVARDYEDAQDFFDPIRLLAQGFGLLEGKSIRMAGLFGGGLPLTSEDGWGLEEEAPAGPPRRILLTSPLLSREEGSFASGKPVVVGEEDVCELRAYGFSETGQSFVIATRCDLILFAR